MLKQAAELPLTLYVATSNPGKLRDFALAAGPQARIEPLPGLAAIAAPEETEDTFEGNARLKAIAYSLHAPGRIVLADDSGLEVDALGDAPGVRSARFADDSGFVMPASPDVHRSSDPAVPGVSDPAVPGVSDPAAPGVSDPDARNNACLLHALASTPAARRQGRYRCSLAAALDGMVVATADGVVEGVLLESPRGTSGFGYDPLFFIPELGRTMAELDAPTRLARSHRGAALRQLLLCLDHENLA